MAFEGFLVGNSSECHLCFLSFLDLCKLQERTKISAFFQPANKLVFGKLCHKRVLV